MLNMIVYILQKKVLPSWIKFIVVAVLSSAHVAKSWESPGAPVQRADNTYPQTHVNTVSNSN